METEMTNELKQRFFAQYFGQNIQRAGDDPAYYIVDPNWCKEDWYIELKPLSSITDEDAIEISKAENWNYENDPTETNIQSVKNMIINSIEYNRGATNLFTYQYLLSESYALPFMGIPVEQQVQSGWVKLITDK